LRVPEAAAYKFSVAIDDSRGSQIFDFGSRGIDVGRHQIVIAPEVELQLWTSVGASPVWAPMTGLSLGFVWRIGQRFALVSEAAAYKSSVAIDYSRGSQMFHLGIGFLY
jgi:hypothetical protein